jgi:ribosomal protein L7/L12
MAEFSIVLVSVEANVKGPAAAALGQVLGIPGDAVAPVLEAAPTVLFGGLNFRQGKRVMEVLAPVVRAGAILILAEGKSGGLSALSWPAEPVLNGKQISQYSAPPGGLTCPACGTPLEVDVHILEQATPPQGGPALPDVPQLPRDNMSRGTTPGTARHRSSVALNITDVEKVWKERASAASGSSGNREAVKDGTKGTSIAGAPPAQQGKSSSSALMKALDTTPPLTQAESGEFDVLASGSSNPKLPEIIARTRGISVKEARLMAQKRLISVAKAVDRDTAQKISAELQKLNIKAKVIPRRGSGEIPATNGTGEK